MTPCVEAQHFPAAPFTFPMRSLSITPVRQLYSGAGRPPGQGRAVPRQALQFVAARTAALDLPGDAHGGAAMSSPAAHRFLFAAATTLLLIFSLAPSPS